MIISEKAKKAFYTDMIEKKNFLLVCEFSDLYKGLTVTQEYFYCMERPTGFLKAQINMTQCTMPREKII